MPTHPSNCAHDLCPSCGEGRNERARADRTAQPVRTDLPLLRRRLRRCIAQPDGRGGAAIDGRSRPIRRISGDSARRARRSARRSALEARLLHPMLRQARRHARARRLGRRRSTRSRSGFGRIIERRRAGRGRVLSLRPVADRGLLRRQQADEGLLGSANVDTNSRLCMASSVAGHRRAFGADTVPGSYADLDEADLIVLVGSNAAWCHPVLFQRMMQQQGRARRASIVVIDPRRTATADEADLFLPIAPGTDTALFCGLLVASRRTRRARSAPMSDATPPALPKRWRAHARSRPTSAATARATGLDEARRRAFLRSVPRHARASSPAIRRASTSRRRAPTRSTPSSTAISPPAASASPAWGRSRSPASPTRWAGARSAGSPTSSPRTWVSRRPRSTACAGSGTRRAWRRAKASRPCRCSRRSRAARSRRCG